MGRLLVTRRTLALSRNSRCRSRSGCARLLLSTPTLDATSSLVYLVISELDA